ncbi:NAD(P)H-dependent oxidoreductase [Flavobacterium orientale]|uniref:NAD(P)H oxidoreductase n=1 Tax=Flavobacterium orientale TaxID=1756020 RepID=A0A916Y176_9FLAO|nr:NAD(P)H-dependent oxidoreductase [Flavobacterium orientale]GGD26063.1 NAD(P)H oxidoreductase [Flavobacterium orientale]
MTTNKILILFAHPLFEKSMINRILIEYLLDSPNVTLHDLYEEYPEFDIDIKREQDLLMEHDIIIWHHPFYWYSCPPLLKQWIDLVLEYNWAYGKSGNALKDKIIFQAITTGGSEENYCSEGRDRFTISELLEPFNQTAMVCKMNYLPPFVIHGTHKMNSKEALDKSRMYNKLLQHLIENGIGKETFENYPYLNQWIQTKQ